MPMPGNLGLVGGNVTGMGGGGNQTYTTQPYGPLVPIGGHWQIPTPSIQTPGFARHMAMNGMGGYQNPYLAHIWQKLLQRQQAGAASFGQQPGMASNVSGMSGSLPAPPNPGPWT